MSPVVLIDLCKGGNIGFYAFGVRKFGNIYGIGALILSKGDGY